MDAEQCIAFLTALGAAKIRVKDNGWVVACCPLAQWTHQHGTDHTPSFGLSIAPGQRSYYSCFACRSGGVEELLQSIEMYVQGYHEGSSKYNFALAHQLLNEEVQVLPLPEYGSYQRTEAVFEEWPQYWLGSFTPVLDAHQAAAAYLQGRRVSVSTVMRFDLRYDSKRQMILCPYWDVFGRFAGARGRAVLEGQSGASKHFDYSWQGRNNCRLVWYNEKSLNMPGPVVVVEGQFDCWRVEERWPKVVANLTAKPSLEKMKKLADSPMVIQIPDNDVAGHESIVTYHRYCEQLGIRHKVLTLDEGVKDPDQCHPDYLKDKIEELL